MGTADKQSFWKEWRFSIVVTTLSLLAALAYVSQPNDPRGGPVPGQKGLTSEAAGAAGGQATDKASAMPTASPADIKQAIREYKFVRFLFRLLLLTAVVSACVWFAYAFTGNPFEKRTEEVRFAYFFVLASFALLTIPPLVKSQAIGTEPIGIISGCVTHTDVDQLRCTRRPERRTDNETDSANETPVARDKKNGTAGPGAGSGNQVAAEKAGDDPAYMNQWLVNIGGTLSSQSGIDCAAEPAVDCKLGSSTNRAFITGGVVVPLPFVIIAMFGGAISLSRRVPEIQKRSEPGYVGTASEPALQAGEVREQLVFQILQFVSAPLIAITAHQVIEPEGQSTAVALAFMSGFGSETILIMVRGVVNGIQPKGLVPAAAHTGTVGGIVTDAGQPVANIDVRIADSTLSDTTDKDGRYEIRDVPAGKREVIVDESNRSAKVPVTVVPGRSAQCDVPLVHTGSIKGIVVNAQGAPFPNAKVHVQSQPVINAKTGKDGTCRLNGVPVGDQEVKVEGTSGKDKLNGSAKVTVEFGKTVECTIALK